jgi:hypothetical protein
MEWLLTAIPIALVVLVCGGLHMLMMRGMHGGHAHGGDAHSGASSDLHGATHEGHDAGRVARLESQVASLRQELEASKAAARDGNGKAESPARGETASTNG